MNKNEILTKIGNVLRKISLRFEILYLILLIVAFILRLLLITDSGLIATLVFSIVAIIYFFCAFADNYEGELSALGRFFNKLFELSSSVMCIGILFKLQYWPNSISFLTVGVLTMGISFAYKYFTRNKDAESPGIVGNLVYRTITLLGITLIIFLVTSK